MQRSSAIPTATLILWIAAILNISLPHQTLAADGVPAHFQDMLGWWKGTGHLKFREGKREQIECRATYRWDAGASQLLQAVRCATQSGKVEVKSTVREVDGKLTGTWNETTYKLSGDLSGELKPKGFRVNVTGHDLHANMVVLVQDQRQIVEIQFHDSTLIGLTMIFGRS